jgi:hypothetical protein
MLGTDGAYLYFGPYTWTDLFRRRLRVHNIHHGISTMRRMVKYSRRGFYACVGTIRDIKAALPADVTYRYNGYRVTKRSSDNALDFRMEESHD